MGEREKAVRYLLGALFLASCTMLTPLATNRMTMDTPIPAPEVVPVPAVQPQTLESTADVPKQKPKPTSPVPKISSCAALDAGDLKETIKAKLDCITENTP